MILSLIVAALSTTFMTPLQPAVGLATTLQRFYPNSPFEPRQELTIDAARGERVSFQVVVQTQNDPVEIKVAVNAPDGVMSQVRRVGYVSMHHLNTGTPPSEIEGASQVPGLVPDPLFPSSDYLSGPHETNAFWVTLTVAKDSIAGERAIPVFVQLGSNTPIACIVHLISHKAILEPRRDFPVTHWFYCDALSDFYKVKPFDEKFWPIFEKYVRDLVEHGNDVMHTPIFTPPTDGVKKPNQLLRITRDHDEYRFDWSDVKRFIDLTKKCGIKRYEWSHFFSQWGCKNAIRIYEGDPEGERLLWPAETPATSPIYRTFLSHFIPELAKFLDAEGIREVSYFHISDEPHGDEALANYRAARQMMRELAPWMKFMDALSQISFAKEGLVDMPIPSIETAPEFAEAGYPAWCYFCCGPRGPYLNRLMDTPLTKIRMSGWLFYRLKSKGFLHWGYNYWYQSQTRHMIDPFTEQSGLAWPGWAYGDPFMVYPGADGPIDSLRWEVFAESLQDFALLQQSGIPVDAPSLKEIKSYALFPKTADWIVDHRKQVLAAIDAKS